MFYPSKFSIASISLAKIFATDNKKSINEATEPCYFLSLDYMLEIDLLSEMPKLSEKEYVGTNGIEICKESTGLKYTYKETSNKTPIDNMTIIKETYDDLPATGNVEGDCWMVTTADETHDIGSYVWILNTELPAGGEWQFLGQTFDTTNFPTFSDLTSATTTLNNRITSEVGSINSKIDLSVTSSDKMMPKSYMDNINTTLTQLIDEKHFYYIFVL